MIETRPPEHARISFLRWTLVKKYKIVRFEKVWIFVVFWEPYGITNRCKINKMATRGRPRGAKGLPGIVKRADNGARAAPPRLARGVVL